MLDGTITVESSCKNTLHFFNYFKGNVVYIRSNSKKDLVNLCCNVVFSRMAYDYRYRLQLFLEFAKYTFKTNT